MAVEEDLNEELYDIGSTGLAGHVENGVSVPVHGSCCRGGKEGQELAQAAHGVRGGREVGGGSGGDAGEGGRGKLRLEAQKVLRRGMGEGVVKVRLRRE